MEMMIKESGFTKLDLGKDKVLQIHVDKRINASMLLTYGECRELQSRIEVEEGASFTILMKRNHETDMQATMQATIHRDAYFHTALCDLEDGETAVNLAVNLCEEGAHAQVKTATIVTSKKKFHITCEHLSAHTIGEMENYAVVKNHAHYYMEAIGKIVKGAKESASHQTTRVLTTTKDHSSEVLPVLLIDENNVKASHATTVGQPDENQLYYLQSRGLSRDMAMGLLTVGYLMPITELLDDEELQKELQNEIEMKVGLHV